MRSSPEDDVYLFRVAVLFLLAVLIVAATEGRCEEMGPPPPKVYTNCPVGQECEGAKRHDRVLRYVAIQTSAAAVDIWATGYCLSHNPLCVEKNPLGQTAEQRIAIKAMMISGFAIFANELDKRGHENQAIGVTVVGVMLHLFLATRAIRIGNQK